MAMAVVAAVPLLAQAMTLTSAKRKSTGFSRSFRAAVALASKKSQRLKSPKNPPMPTGSAHGKEYAEPRSLLPAVVLTLV